MSSKIKTYLSYFIISIIPLIIYIIPSLKFSHVIPNGYFGIIKFMPYLIFIIISFLGLKLNQTRIFFSSLLFLLTYHSLSEPNLLMDLGIGMIRSRQIFAVTLPLSLSLIFILKEYPLFNIKSLYRLLLSLTPLFIFGIIFVLSPNIFVIIVDFKFFNTGFSSIPHIGFVFFIIYIIFNIFNNDEKISLFKNGVLFSLISFYTAAHIALLGFQKFTYLIPSNIICFTAISIVLIHSIYKMYWKRVYIDELTDIPNRRALDEKLDSLSGLYSISIMDIDHFKKFNDTYGHAEGDSVLRMVADTLHLELGDNVYRYGGEEFCSIFPNINAEDSYKLIDKARTTLSKREFFIRRTKGSDRKLKNRGKLPPAEKIQVTMSMGIASPDELDKTTSKVIINADQALYLAKENGRNCVKIFKQPTKDNEGLN